MLESKTEYRIDDVYATNLSENARHRGHLFFRTDSEGRIWVKGAGKPEDACLTHWFESHPRLVRIGRY